MTIPSKGDETPDITWAAVGAALTIWEQMESGLAQLYSIFTERPYLLTAIEDFGQEGRIHAQRLSVLMEAAEAYFIKRPNQDHEGEIREIEQRATALAKERNNIAHGMQVGIPVLDPTGAKSGDWIMPAVRSFLAPPWYSRARLTYQEFAISSEGIMASASRFADLRDKVQAFAVSLSPPP